MLLQPFWLALGFIAPPLLIYVVFALMGRHRLIGKWIGDLAPGADARFIGIVERAILWLLVFGTSQLMYTWIRHTLSN